MAIAWLPGPPGTRRRVAKLSVEEPDAAEPARPDLWGARVSNDPGLPDLDKGGCHAFARSRGIWEEYLNQYGALPHIVRDVAAAFRGGWAPRGRGPRVGQLPQARHTFVDGMVDLEVLRFQVFAALSPGSKARRRAPGGRPSGLRRPRAHCSSGRRPRQSGPWRLASEHRRAWPRATMSGCARMRRGHSWRCLPSVIRMSTEECQLTAAESSRHRSGVQRVASCGGTDGAHAGVPGARVGPGPRDAG